MSGPVCSTCGEEIRLTSGRSGFTLSTMVGSAKLTRPPHH